MFDRYGFYKPRKLRQQVRIGNYGIADMVGFEFSKDHAGELYPEIYIYELKQDKISVSAFIQACRYARGIQHYFRIYRERYFFKMKINIVLVGKQIDLDSDFVYLTEVLSSEYFDLKMFTYDYCLDGLEFKCHANYSLVTPGF